MRWLFLLALCACGDNLTGTPLADFEAESDRVTCERLVRCGLVTDEDACTSALRPHHDANLAAAIADGVVRYDGPSAEACLAALAAMTCDTSSRDARVLPLACEQMFAGTLAHDAPCGLDEECRSGRCDAPGCNQACCIGSCRADRAFAAIGKACELDEDCVTDAYCGSDGLCRALEGIAGLCESDRQCDYGLGCIGATDLMAGNCRALPLVGEPCPYLRCAEIGARCQTGGCVAVGLPGDPCASDADCSPFAQCDAAANVCTALPLLGQPCNSQCGGTAYCDFSITQTCAAPKDNQQPCTADDQCTSQFCAEGPIFDFCADRPLCF